MSRFIQSINGYLWGLPMIAFLLCLHIYNSVRYRFVQRKVLRGIRLSVSEEQGTTGDISPFSALATSLASTLGTGNIVGVSTAVALGGAGAVFWCWVSGVLGMATQYAETVLSLRYREKSPCGVYRGGPMYVLRNGVGSKYSAIAYALLASVSGLITGAAIQTNAMSDALLMAFTAEGRVYASSGEVPLIPLLVGVFSALLTAAVIFGGISKISRICSLLVPFMAVSYTLGCVAVLIINRSVFFDGVRLIVSEAFSLRAVSGGGAGSAMMLAMRYGLARGMFSNEAGLGTSSVVSACASTDNPVRQGLVTMTATFWDTVVMCLVTGLTVVTSAIGRGVSDNIAAEGSGLCFDAFAQIPYVGRGMLVFALITFAFSTVIGWCWTGESCFGFVFGDRFIVVYRVLWVLAVAVSPLMKLDAVWSVGDLCNGLLVIPNSMALIMLSPMVKKETDKHIHKY